MVQRHAPDAANDHLKEDPMNGQECDKADYAGFGKRGKDDIGVVYFLAQSDAHAEYWTGFELLHECVDGGKAGIDVVSPSLELKCVSLLLRRDEHPASEYHRDQQQGRAGKQA